MPLYEYECETCGARFEVIQKFSDSPIEACRVCGGPVHKLISRAAIQFKGTGWYITDYAKRNGVSASHSPSPSSSSNGGSKSETPAATGTSSSTPSSDTSSAPKKE